MNISLKHTQNCNERIRAAMNLFHLSTHAFEVFEEKSKYLARKIVDKSMVERFLKEVINEKDTTRSQHQREKVVELFKSGRGNRGKNAWELANAAVEFVDYYRTSDKEKALDSAMFGSGSLIKERAFEVALAL